MKNVQRAIAVAALLGFAGAASASDLQMCLYPQAGGIVDATVNVLSCLINALIEPA